MTKKSFHHRRGTRAFTLVELVITIALFALVAGLVISFITFMNRFTAQNEALSDRVEQASELRAEIDRWFSYFDRQEYTISLSADGVRATPVDGGTSYSLTFVSPGGEEGGEMTLLASYPRGNGYNDQIFDPEREEFFEGENARVVCDEIASVAFWQYTPGWNFTAGEGDASLRFLIDCRVKGTAYACEIRYA